MNGENIPDNQKKRLDSLFEAFSLVAEGTYVYLCDMRYDYSRWSKSAVDTFGLPGEYMYEAGAIFEEHIHPEDRDAYRRSIESVFRGNRTDHDIQYRARRADGEYDVCTCRGVVIYDETGNPEYFGGVIRNHALHGHIDTLTGLRNQYGFFEDLKLDIANNNEVRVMMVGIAGFTEMNEVYGYKFGNTLLQKFGRYMLDSVGNNGSVYRMDGTKFAVISTTQSSEEMSRHYTKLRTHFRKGIPVEDRLVPIELNAGLLTLDDFSVDDQTAYGCLNFAYGESKVRRQGDLVEFYNDLNEENRQRIEKFQVIRHSITNNKAGFYLVYQPYVNARSEEPSGAEALLRWKNDEYGVVPPDLFIPLLERDPLFPELGEWILRTAITDAKRMLELNPNYVINVNLSYTQLEKKDFTDKVLEMLEELNYPPEHLCLEITERCKLLDLQMLKNIIVKLRSRGIQFALDDFGTGFSSLGIAREIPLDTIKIDRSFIEHIEESDHEKELIGHFTRFAGTFGALVCVEGIENAGMRDILRNYNVHSFQGYFYSKPLEIDDLIAWEMEH